MIHVYRSIIPTLWLLWIGYWAISARGTKPAERREDPGSRLVYTVPMLLGAVLLAVPHIAGPALDHRFIQRRFVMSLIAVALVAIGIGFSCLARAWLGGNWSSNVTLKQDHELIRSGPYRLVRHPIYTGLLLAIFGTALAIGEWRALIACALFGISIFYKLRLEECFMLERFGGDYRRYAASVPALVPFWRWT